MPSVSPNVRQAAAASTLQFDWLLGDKNFFSFADLGVRTDMSESFIEKLWDDKQHALHVSGHEYNAGKGLRMTKRVARAFAVRLLITSAQYTSEEKLRAYLSCLREFSREELLQIAREAYAHAQNARA